MKLTHYIYKTNLILSTCKHSLTTMLKLKLNGFPQYIITKKGERHFIKGFNDIVKDYLNVKYNIHLIYDESWTDPFTVFIYKEYKSIPVKNKVVVDVGANIGDSSIFFVLNGAQKVIAIEPFPHFYNILIPNIEENNYKNKIIPINAIVGYEERFVKMNIDKEMTTGIQAELSDIGKRTKMINLDYIVKHFNINNCVLKMDCEGCEYDSILKSNDETLRHFEYIMLEYHYGHEGLLKKLKEAGFKAKYTRPHHSYNRCAKILIWW